MKSMNAPSQPTELDAATQLHVAIEQIAGSPAGAQALRGLIPLLLPSDSAGLVRVAHALAKLQGDRAERLLPVFAQALQISTNRRHPRPPILIAD